MITVYHKIDAMLHKTEITGGQLLPPDPLWVDAYTLTLDEEKSLEQQLGIEIPTHDEIWKNRVLSRFYEENGVFYMPAAIITKVDTPYPQTSTVTFILSKQALVTIRYIIPTSFQHFTERLLSTPQKFGSSGLVLEGLLAEMITRVVYNSDMVVQDLDNITHGIFNNHLLDEHVRQQSASHQMKNALKTLGTCADLNSKINLSLHSFSRLLSFFQQTHMDNRELMSNLQILYTDVNSLIQQSAFLSDKITFLLDAVLGLINVEQNFIMKIFSVVTVFFVPATLICGVYGMNFKDMPELNWNYGYPYALALITLCIASPFFYFRKKGWL